MFSTSPDGQRLILCIDEEFAGFNREGRGQRLFGDDGKPSAYVDNVLKFLQEYQTQFLRTQAFCAKVRELDVLEPMQAQVELASGERMALGGFMAVSRSKLKAVSGDKLAELAQTDELELLYLHLQSMRNFLSLKDRLAVVEGGKMAGLAATETSDGNQRVRARRSRATRERALRVATAPATRRPNNLSCQGGNPAMRPHPISLVKIAEANRTAGRMPR